MRAWVWYGLLASLAACSTGRMGADKSTRKNAVEACQQSVDAGFDAHVVAPGRSTTGVCRVNGGMTLCRGEAAASAFGKDRSRPLGSHAEDSRPLLADCLAGKA